RDILAALKEKGISSSYPQITSALKSGGFRRRSRRRRTGAANAAATTTTSHASGNGLNVEALIAAKALISKVGSVAAAEQAIQVLKKLG
ncbi:MAG TPA: hypothetical protein VGH32_07365, partial [Pirellulales bacterium]